VIPMHMLDRELVQPDLDRLITDYPDMAGLVRLYQGIDEIQSAIAVSDLDSRPFSECERELLDAGRPLLTFEQLDVDGWQLAKDVRLMREHLARHGVDVTSDAGEEHKSPSWLLTTLREGFERGAGPTDEPFLGSLTAMALGQVMVGILRRRARAYRDTLDVSWWYRGYCPVCGGWPDVGLLTAEKGERTLICGRCDTGWPYRRVGCPFCGDDLQIRYFASEDNRFRVYVCEKCQTYVKHIQIPVRGPIRSLLGLRLMTVGLDLEAEAQGFQRTVLARETAL